MAKYIYGNTLIAFEVAKSNDVATEFQAVQTMSIAEEIRTNDAIKFPAGEGNNIRITENAGQRATKVLAFDVSGDLELQTGLEAAQAATAADVVLTNADVVLTGDDVVSTGDDVIAAAAEVVLAATEKGYAEEWATKAEDSLISVAAGGDGSADYSALHHAAKAAASAATAHNTKELTITSWDMTSVGSFSINHGLSQVKIKKVSALIFSDPSGSIFYDFSTYLPAGSTASYIAITDTQITLVRSTNGFFDTADFDGTGFDRGLIIVKYAD